MNRPIIFFTVALLLLSSVLASQPIQQSNKILLSPFYRASTTANTNYTYNLEIRPPETIKKVLSAIITFEVWMNPTVDFTLFVNGKPCDNPSYTISTTYSGAGRANAVFDCSNIITREGDYKVTFRANKNTGAITAWIDLTYLTTPGSMMVAGTEYSPGDDGKVFVTLANDGVPQNNADCIVEIFYPNSTEFLEYTSMSFLEDGIFYHDFTIPSILGVYPVEVLCSYLTVEYLYNATEGARLLGSGSGPLSNTYTIDGSVWTSNEDLADNRLIKNSFNYTTSINLSVEMLNSITLKFVGERNIGGSDPASDPINFWIYNFNTSKYELIGSDFSYLASITSKQYTFLSQNKNLTDYINGGGKINIVINDTVSTPTDATNTNLRIDQLIIDIETIEKNSTITTIAGGGELHVTEKINISLVSAQVADYVWNSSNRNLTYYPSQVDLTNYSNISASVWAYNETINPSLLSQFFTGVWNYVGRYIHGTII